MLLDIARKVHDHERHSLSRALAGALLAGAAGCAAAQDITGAGATFPAPVYAKWADAYNKATGARINYQSVGSGAGIKQIERQDGRLRRLRHAAEGRGPAPRTA